MRWSKLFVTFWLFTYLWLFFYYFLQPDLLGYQAKRQPNTAAMWQLRGSNAITKLLLVDISFHFVVDPLLHFIISFFPRADDSYVIR